MVAFISTSASMSWNGYTISPTSISVTSPTPETATIPYLYDARGAAPRTVPTGDWAEPGTVSVTYNHSKSSGIANIFNDVGRSSNLTYSDVHGHQIVMNAALLKSVTENISTGAVVSITLEFEWTSFLGTP